MPLVKLFLSIVHKPKGLRMLDNRRNERKAEAHARRNPLHFKTSRTAKEKLRHRRSLQRAAVVYHKHGWSILW